MLILVQSLHLRRVCNAAPLPSLLLPDSMLRQGAFAESKNGLHKMHQNISEWRCNGYILATRLCNAGHVESPFFDRPPAPPIQCWWRNLMQKRAISEVAEWPNSAGPAAPKSTPKSMSSWSLIHQHWSGGRGASIFVRRNSMSSVVRGACKSGGNLLIPSYIQ